MTKNCLISTTWLIDFDQIALPVANALYSMLASGTIMAIPRIEIMRAKLGGEVCNVCYSYDIENTLGLLPEEASSKEPLHLHIPSGGQVTFKK
jgi:hypothetical protein